MLQVSPLVYGVLGSLVLYFMWRDVLLYRDLSCSSNLTAAASPAISVKVLLQPPTIHYLELPLAEWLEAALALSSLLSANTVSGAGVLLGLAAAAAISRGSRAGVVAGVALYKARDLADSLDGVLARGAGRVMVPTPGTWGYYIDGWCDIASETALIYSLGCLLALRQQPASSWAPGSKGSSCSSWVAQLAAPLTAGVWGLGLQSIVAAVGWNWTTGQLHQLLAPAGPGPQLGQLVGGPGAGLVVLSWRLLNPHLLTQALLAALLLERAGQWVWLARWLVTPPLLLLCAASWLLVRSLRHQLQAS